MHALYAHYITYMYVGATHVIIKHRIKQHFTELRSCRSVMRTGAYFVMCFSLLKCFRTKWWWYMWAKYCQICTEVIRSFLHLDLIQVPTDMEGHEIDLIRENHLILLEVRENFICHLFLADILWLLHFKVKFNCWLLPYEVMTLSSIYLFVNWPAFRIYITWNQSGMSYMA